MTLTKPLYRCLDCKKKHKDKFPKQQQAMACNYFASDTRHKYRADHNNKGNPTIKYTKCVGNYYFGMWSNYINFYPKYESGIMAFSGGLMEQPAKFVEVMDLVHNLIEENKKEVDKFNHAAKGRHGR